MKITFALSLIGLSCMMICGCGAERVVPNNSDTTPYTKGLEALFGDELIDSDENTYDLSVIEDRIIGIYFGALWCPPCRDFVPELVKVYNELKARDKPFEIVFVTSDKDRNEMIKYMKRYKMDWYALKFGSPVIPKIKSHYSIRGIPSFIVIGPDGYIITTDGRAQIIKNKSAAFETWASKTDL